jgi:hypothetical protein
MPSRPRKECSHDPRGVPIRSPVGAHAPQQIAAVLTYVRCNFNTCADPVAVKEVEQIAGTAGATVDE